MLWRGKPHETVAFRPYRCVRCSKTCFPSRLSRVRVPSPAPRFPHNHADLSVKSVRVSAFPGNPPQNPPQNGQKEGNMVDFSWLAHAHACPICGAEAYLKAYPDGHMTVRRRCDHNPDPSRALDALEDMVRQFACHTTMNGAPAYSTGGLSTLEYAFDVLGWSDPHPAPEERCEHPGCEEWATCGVSTREGYQRLCFDHSLSPLRP